MSDQPVPLVVIDSANVVGAVPDGWWRDRVGATTRLRDALGPLAARGLTATEAEQRVPDWASRPPLEVVLVVEGVARDVPGSDTVRVVSTRGSGDDAIVDLVRTEGPGRPVLVITADRPLRTRVTDLGAQVAGPHVLRAFRAEAD
jgi:hypothetical protein